MFDKQRYERELLYALDLNENDEAVVRGVVTQVDVGCEQGMERCHFHLEFSGLTISVYYHFGTQGACLNTSAGEVGDRIEKGEQVEVFGKHYELGSITTCDSIDYYILRE